MQLDERKNMRTLNKMRPEAMLSEDQLKAIDDYEAKEQASGVCAPWPSLCECGIVVPVPVKNSKKFQVVA